MLGWGEWSSCARAADVVYEDEGALLPKNTSVIVRRIPIGADGKPAAELVREPAPLSAIPTPVMVSAAVLGVGGCVRGRIPVRGAGGMKGSWCSGGWSEALGASCVWAHGWFLLIKPGGLLGAQHGQDGGAGDEESRLNAFISSNIPAHLPRYLPFHAPTPTDTHTHTPAPSAS